MIYCVINSAMRNSLLQRQRVAEANHRRKGSKHSTAFKKRLSVLAKERYKNGWSPPNKTHGYTRTRIYRIWQAMKNRCDNQKGPRWKDWGGRGITYDPRWAKFENFLADMGEPPAGLTLERKDNDGPYSKANCYWATALEQNYNSRHNRWIEYHGETRSVSQWADSLGINRTTLLRRLQKLSVEQAFTAQKRR